MVDDAVPQSPEPLQLPQAPDPDPVQQFDLHQVAANLDQAGACLQQLAAKAQKKGETEKAQDLRDRADIFLDTAEFLRTIVGFVAED